MCDCVTLLNEALAEHNAKLDTALGFDKKTWQFEPLKAQIRICKVDTKNRKPLAALVAEYCPFCGDRYKWPDPKEMSDEQLTAELNRAARQYPVLEEKHREFRYESWERGDTVEEGT